METTENKNIQFQDGENANCTSELSPDELEVEEIKDEVVSRQYGLYVTFDESECEHVVYLNVPKESYLCLVENGILIPEDSSFLKRLRQQANISQRIKSVWKCQRKGYGRLRATCSK